MITYTVSSEAEIQPGDMVIARYNLSDDFSSVDNWRVIICKEVKDGMVHSIDLNTDPIQLDQCSKVVRVENWPLR